MSMAEHSGGAGVTLELRDIHKRYGALDVLSGLNLSVSRGEVYGFLGKNGAGKSTAIRIMLGITKADRGEVFLFGQHDRDSVKTRQRIGYVAQEQNFYRWMTPSSIARFVRGFYPGWSQEHYVKLCRRFELPVDRAIGGFSGGMKARLALSLALASGPELLILDEPTAGMDPVARREFLDLVREQAIGSGATVLFSTHLIDDIEAVANRICIVDHGVSCYEGALAPLIQSIKTFTSMPGIEQPRLILDAETGHSVKLLRAEQLDDRQSLVLQAPAQSNLFSEEQLSYLRQLGWNEKPMSLEEVFVSFITAQSRAD